MSEKDPALLHGRSGSAPFVSVVRDLAHHAGRLSARIGTLPADNAAITVLGTASSTCQSNLAFHRDAFTFACADLPLPKGVDMAARVSDKQLGMSVRMVRAYDINNDKFPCRLDILYGWKTLYPELACRIQG